MRWKDTLVVVGIIILAPVAANAVPAFLREFYSHIPRFFDLAISGISYGFSLAAFLISFYLAFSGQRFLLSILMWTIAIVGAFLIHVVFFLGTNGVSLLLPVVYFPLALVPQSLWGASLGWMVRQVARRNFQVFRLNFRGVGKIAGLAIITSFFLTLVSGLFVGGSGFSSQYNHDFHYYLIRGVPFTYAGGSMLERKVPWPKVKLDFVRWTFGNGQTFIRVIDLVELIKTLVFYAVSSWPVALFLSEARGKWLILLITVGFSVLGYTGWLWSLRL